MDTIHTGTTGKAALMRIKRRLVARRLAFAIVSLIAAAAAGAQAPADQQPDAQTTPNALAVTTPGNQSSTSTRATQAPFVYGIDAGIEETDNVTLVESNKVSQTIAVVDADFDLKETTRLLDATAKGDFSYLDYLQNAYGSEFLGRFDGMLRAALIPERLSWTVQDDFGQSTIDPFQETTPTNLENINYFATGPDLNLNLGPTAFFNATARYARVQYQTSPFDSNRLQESLAFGLNLSSRSSVSLNGDNERVMFSNTVLNEDYNRSNVFLRYALQGARTEVTVDGGVTRTNTDGDSTTGGLARAVVTRKLSSAATLSLTAGHVVTDAGSNFSSLQSGAVGVIGAAPAPQTGGTYTDNYGSAEWRYIRGRTTLAVSGRYEKDSYSDDAPLDNKRYGGEFKVTRQLSRDFEADLIGRFYKTDFPQQTIETVVVGSPNYDDELIAASLAWHFGRGLEIRLRAEHDARVTTGNDAGYKDNRGLLTIGYRPRPTDITMGGPAGI